MLGFSSTNSWHFYESADNENLLEYCLGGGGGGTAAANKIIIIDSKMAQNKNEIRLDVNGTVSFTSDNYLFGCSHYFSSSPPAYCL